MPATPVLTNRALMLAKIETTFNVDALPTPVANAFLVMNADCKINPNVLKRNFYHPSLSQVPIAIGRKLASITLTHEIKGSGTAGAIARLGTLLRGCGFAQTLIGTTAAATIENPVANSVNTGPVITWTKSVAPTQGWGQYQVVVVLGGASATAKVQVFGLPADYDDTDILPSNEYSATIMGPGATTTVAVDVTDPLSVEYAVGTPQIGDIIVVSVGGLRFKHTVASTVPATVATALAAVMVDANARFSAAPATNVVTVTVTGGVTTITTAVTPVLLGESGAEVTLSWTGSLVLGDNFTIDLLKPGYHYTPVSTGFESLTIYMYYDGTLHRLTGCMGTVQFTAQAGNYGTAAFTFTGQYNDPDDQPLPLDAIFETSVPQQVELAELLIGNSKRLCAQSYNIDMGITITPRDCVSAADGYNGVMYTSREPRGGANPEMALESEEPYWRNMARASILKFHGRVGTHPNNEVDFYSNSIQLTGITYADRNNLRVYDLGFGFMQESFNGDDEIRVVIS